MTPESGRLTLEPPSPLRLHLKGGELVLHYNWLNPGRATALFEKLLGSLQWEQSRLNMYGRSVAIPRLNAWYADERCEYRYSGYQLPLHAWTHELQEIRELLRATTGTSFNSVLANLYRDGNDSVGWHSDDEPELGANPLIASLSLGTTRRFRLRHKWDKGLGNVDLELESGSLLVMSGAIQHHWRHCVPKSPKSSSARINLTFRRVLCESHRD